ncbi:DUF2332 domain-containing protein [Phyllobacterium sp. A18/5-2]|uniref:DUF2332 domain-containing protein n=1 Tax=Phyllobacterium sp. A18/5-2 TaxID=2978392 RepID=UPI002905782E|nr:DUF2332 domain-containing protein [Phyllobacterium sp. A18/5-2]
MYQQQFAEISARYRRFAEEEARGRSPLYEQLANGVADDQEVLAFLATLPKDKQQPNLLLGAVRHLFGLLGSWNEFRRRITANFDDVRTLMLARSTQTNEPARCATLLPILAQLPQPLALIEVGASAGLNLLPDFYSYDFGGVVLRATAPTVEAPLFSCKVNEAAPLPAAMPKIVWRAGLDLNPLEVSDPEQAVWLERLVWPEQRHRLARSARGHQSCQIGPAQRDQG